MNQGKQANKTGKTLENQVHGLLKESGYEEIMNKDFSIDTPSCIDKFFVKHCFVGYSIYQTKLYADVYLVNDEKQLILGMEIKWQQANGSVDEKYPYIIENIKNVFPCPAIIILDGKGYKKGAKQWLENQVDNKFLGVYSLSEFIAWVNNGGI